MIDNLKSICSSVFKIIMNKFKKLKKTQQIMIVSIIVVLLIVLLCVITNGRDKLTETNYNKVKSGKLTEANYNKVEIGMTYDEVVELIGECNYSGNIDFPEYGYYSTMCDWYIEEPNGNKPGGAITFVDGIVTSKTDWIDISREVIDDEFEENESSIPNKSTITSGLTGIEQAVEDGMIGEDYITEGVSEDKLKFAFTDGNLQMYYDSWEECLKDAKKLKIITSSEKHSTMEEELDNQYLNQSQDESTLIKTYNTLNKEDSHDYHTIKVYQHTNGDYSYEIYWNKAGAELFSKSSDGTFKTIDKALESAVQTFMGITLEVSDLTEE